MIVLAREDVEVQLYAAHTKAEHYRLCVRVFVCVSECVCECECECV